MFSSLISILVIALIIGTIWWVCDYLPVPEPLNRIVKLVSVVIGIIAVIYVLLQLGGVALPPLAA